MYHFCCNLSSYVNFSYTVIGSHINSTIMVPEELKYIKGTTGLWYMNLLCGNKIVLAVVDLYLDLAYTCHGEGSFIRPY